jgi:hypothetical protein
MESVIYWFFENKNQSRKFFNANKIENQKIHETR